MMRAKEWAASRGPASLRREDGFFVEMDSKHCTRSRAPNTSTDCIGDSAATIIDECSHSASSRTSDCAPRNGFEHPRRDRTGTSNTSISSSQDPAFLPDFDRAHKTRRQCLIATLLGILLSLALLALGITAAARSPHTLALRLPIRSTSTWLEVISLAVNVVIGFSQDGMAFAHAASLRWALLAEGRLDFNTNIRLLTHARRATGPNGWPSNAASLASLVLCYGASSVLIVSGEPEDPARDLTCWDLGFQVDSSYAWLNAPALCALGLGLGVQAALAGWCLCLSSRDPAAIPSWNPDPLNTTLAAVRLGMVAHRPGRAMLSAHDAHEPSRAAFPQRRQKSIAALRARTSDVRLVLVLAWLFAAFAVLWPVVLVLVHKTLSCAFCLSWTDECDGADPTGYRKNFVTFSMSPTDLSSAAGFAMVPYAGEMVLGIVYVSTIQATQTCGLHAVELVVNMCRDEGAWRRAASKAGARVAGGGDSSFMAAVQSWESVVLFVAKAVLHWIVGEAMQPTINPSKNKFWLEMAYSRLFVYAILAISTAVFASYLAGRRYKGSQPAAMGCIQTLADLVDDWRTDEKSRFWWGVKTPVMSGAEEMGHTGMKSCRDELGTVSTDLMYA